MSALATKSARALAACAGAAVMMASLAGCGVEYGRTYTFPGEGGSVARVPFTYMPTVPNQWVIVFHGYGQDAQGVLSGGATETVNALLRAGYIVVAMNNTMENCYGNAQCAKDVADLITEYRASFNLQDRPYLIADSMGGFTALNAIALQAVKPKAMVGWCINTNLVWDYWQGNAYYAIGDAYDIDDANPYDVATRGYDPMLDQAEHFAGVPFALWSSYEDQIVSRSMNTDAFAAFVNAAGGSVVVNDSSGAHNDPSNYDPDAVVAFFDSHR